TIARKAATTAMRGIRNVASFTGGVSAGRPCGLDCSLTGAIVSGQAVGSLGGVAVPGCLVRLSGHRVVWRWPIFGPPDRFPSRVATLTLLPRSGNTVSQN